MIRVLLPLLVLSSIGMAQVTTAATTGTWHAYPGQKVIYETQVQQPINADGTSTFNSNGHAVIPVKFTLSQGLTPFVLESIYSDANTLNNYSYLYFQPNPYPTFGQLTNLVANYSFTDGNCHKGALRWTIWVWVTSGTSGFQKPIHIYYGDYPNFTDCSSSGTNQSGVNMLSLTDLRFDLSGLGGPWYGTYQQALTLAGDKKVIWARLHMDGGWGGDQRATLLSATVNDNSYTPQPAVVPPVPTCELPPAKIRVTKIAGNGSGSLDKTETIQPAGNDESFRVLDCKYVYNLATSSLSAPGEYKVEVLIDGKPATGAATFTLR